MLRSMILGLSLVLTAGTAIADEAVDGNAKTLSGMSILGNDEAPTSLVIVPWKSSEIGSPVGLSNVLNAGTQPVDRDVFMRELSYYEIRSGR